MVKSPDAGIEIFVRKGKRLVAKLSGAIEAHYVWMEDSIGRDPLRQLYDLLDTLIALEQPDRETT